MYNSSYEQEEKGKLYFIVAVVVIALIAGSITAIFTNFKDETLICLKSKDICYIQKTNLINLKSRKNLLKYSDIKYVYYVPKSVAGNMYAKGYKYFYPAFMTKNKQSIRIFTTDFYEKDDVEKAVENIKQIMENSGDMIEYSRN